LILARVFEKLRGGRFEPIELPRSKLRGIKPAVIERFEPFKLFNRLNQSEVTP